MTKHRLLTILFIIYSLAVAPNFRQPKIIRVKRTGYCSCEKCCGKWSKYKRTKYGYRPTAHRTIAVDTTIFKPRSWVFVEYSDGRVERRRCEDTGSKIRGKIIDEYFEKHAEARRIRDSVNILIF